MRVSQGSTGGFLVRVPDTPSILIGNSHPCAHSKIRGSLFVDDGTGWLFPRVLVAPLLLLSMHCLGFASPGREVNVAQAGVLRDIARVNEPVSDWKEESCCCGWQGGILLRRTCAV